MTRHSVMVLSHLDKQVLRHLVALFVNLTGIRVKEGIFRYNAEDIRRQLTFGGDFTYGFGDFFKLVFVRSGTKKVKKTRANTTFSFVLQSSWTMRAVRIRATSSTP